MYVKDTFCINGKTMTCDLCVVPAGCINFDTFVLLFITVFS